MLARTLFEIGLPMWDRLTPRTCEDKVIQKQLKARDHDAFADLCSSRSAQTPRWGSNVRPCATRCRAVCR
ncbi:hypothetical protein EBB79_21920 (plasmid) [Parasedimentitalea marina]|uniref:Uncharacterized protein n=1 Tax=Parasedimentitalea marina TaxID=2483033 RepID=A0A3T0N9I4_9RHOB|nr:hypothetical protein [Parasedimentitalea marina]AZV80625.1 hypothetical protein EBB79_21920 [Parasedimentitalea marina]